MNDIDKSENSRNFIRKGSFFNTLFIHNRDIEEKA